MPNPKDNEEEDKVAAAYENISKKLEDIRSGKGSDDEDSEEDEKPKHVNEDELEEWKGPKGVKSEEGRAEIEDEDIELRKVKLEHSEGDDEDEEDDESKESEDSDGSNDDKNEKVDEETEEREEKSSKGDDDKEDEDSEPVKKWKPEENDPLDDDEDSESDEKEDVQSLRSDDLKQNLRSSDLESEESDEDEKPKRDFEPEKFEEEAPIRHSRDDEDEFEETIRPSDGGEIASQDSEVVQTSSPRNDEQSKPKSEYFGEDVKPGHDFERDESDVSFRKPQSSPDTLDDLANKPASEDDDYHIPNLKGARHEQGDMEYNADPSRQRHERAYNNMDNMSKDSDPNNFFSQHQQSPKRANKFHLLILVLIGIAVIGFTVYILKGGFGEINITPEASPSPSPVESASPTPTPTPEPTVERGDFTIRVLNGTSTTGLAGTVSDKLEELGYETANPGNATNSAFTQTQIRIKEGENATALFERLKLDLAPDYDAQQSTNLPDNSTNDAEVILGAN